MKNVRICIAVRYVHVLPPNNHKLDPEHHLGFFLLNPISVMNRFMYFSLAFVFSTSSYGQELEYPSLYTSLNLPQYGNASIIELGRSSGSLKDGVRIFLESTDEYSTLRSFYESEMASLEWTLKESIAVKKMRERVKLDMIPFSAVFEKENLIYQIFSSRVNGLTKLNISLLEKN